MSSTSNNAPCNKFECRICGKIYKRNSGLTRHMTAIKDANSVKPTVYDLPEKAIEETRQVLVYHIKERLKQHLRHVGNVHIMVSCTESQFFGVFKGIYIIIIQKQGIISVYLKALILTLLYHIYWEMIIGGPNIFC